MGLKVKGCCCMNLRIAGYVHGCIAIALVVLGFYIEITRLIYRDDYVKSPLKIVDYEYDPKKSGTFYIVSYSIDAIASGSLIVGIAKNKHLMLLPWLVLRAIGLILIAPVIVIILLISLALTFTDPRAIGVLAVTLAAALIVGLFVWSWIVIYSLYHEIRESKKRPMEMPLPYIENGQIGTAPPYQKFDNNQILNSNS